MRVFHTLQMRLTTREMTIADFGLRSAECLRNDGHAEIRIPKSAIRNGMCYDKSAVGSDFA